MKRGINMKFKRALFLLPAIMCLAGCGAEEPEPTPTPTPEPPKQTFTAPKSKAMDYLKGLANASGVELKSKVVCDTGTFEQKFMAVKNKIRYRFFGSSYEEYGYDFDAKKCYKVDQAQWVEMQWVDAYTYDLIFSNAFSKTNFTTAYYDNPQEYKEKKTYKFNTFDVTEYKIIDIQDKEATFAFEPNGLCVKGEADVLGNEKFEVTTFLDACVIDFSKEPSEY